MASLRSRLNLTPGTIYLIDGSAFVHRAFHALQNMSRSDGFPTNILFVVTRLLLRLLREEQPSHLAFILDGKGPSRRNDIYPAYKANRTKTPEALIQQLAPLQEIISRLGIPSLVSEGFEADDYIASLTNSFNKNNPVVIVGTDKDLRQCLAENVVMWDPAAKDERIITLASFTEETGIKPSSWPDYQALIGDSSDNVPGLPQVGPKTALPLIQEFATLENLFDRLPAIAPKVRNKLEGQRENALLYRELTTLRHDVCPEVTLDDLKVQQADLSPVLELLNEFELRALIREVHSMERAGLWGKMTDPKNTQEITNTGNSGQSSRQLSGQMTDQSPHQSLGQSPDQVPHGNGKQSPARSADSDAQPMSTPDTSTKEKARAQHTANRPEAPPARQRAAMTYSMPSAMVEGSLFALSDTPPPIDKSLLVPCATVNDLPDMEVRSPLFAMPLQSSTFLLAYAAKEYAYDGPITDLASLIKEKELTLVTPDSKLLYKSFADLAVIPAGQWYDLSLAAYLLSPEDRSYDWDFIATRYGDISGSPHANTPRRGLLGLDIYATTKTQIANADLDTVLTAIEAPLVPILVNMEERGITIDLGAFSEFLQEVQKSLDVLTQNIYQMAGGPFNIRSPQQLGNVLFNQLELPKAGKTRGGAMSTSQAALEKLRGKHPIIEVIEEYRTLEKLRSTYLEPLPASADEKKRIHTTFNQTATATGRLSSSNPNLQNIPIRGKFGPRMRACFIAAPEHVLVCADYSQVELRVLAHLSQDPVLLQAFHNNQDIHLSTAALLFDVPPDKVTKDQRRNAKTINFGLIYGMGAQKLGQELGIGLKEAKQFIERYFEHMTKLKEFYESIEQEAARQGFVCTMTGRRRLTPDITSPNNQLRSQARRQAINTRIQGSAADIIKLAMIAVENDALLASLEAKLLLQIHDELVLEARPDAAEQAGQRLAELMGSVKPGGQSMSIPLLVDWGIGHNWNLAH